MIVFQQIALSLNVLLAALFAVDYFVVENPKTSPRAKAKMGVLLTGVFLSFLIILTLFAILSAVLKHNALYLGLFVFDIVPFAIGRLVSYRTLRFYAALQLLAFLLSAATLCVI